MSYDFSADDIFEMAEQLERNGAEFYRTAAEGVKDPVAKELLLGLAAMEVEHEKIFALLRSELSEKDRVFFEKEIDISSMQEILKSAITAEKDAIVFYLGMKNMVPDKLGKDRLNGIIEEEMGHIKILSKELVALKK